MTGQWQKDFGKQSLLETDSSGMAVGMLAETRRNVKIVSEGCKGVGRD